MSRPRYRGPPKAARGRREVAAGAETGDVVAPETEKEAIMFKVLLQFLPCVA